MKIDFLQNYQNRIFGEKKKNILTTLQQNPNNVSLSKTFIASRTKQKKAEAGV